MRYLLEVLSIGGRHVLAKPIVHARRDCSRKRFGSKNYAPLPVVLAKGVGAHLFDTSGKRYIDMMSAYSAVSFGHLHPRLVQAMKNQLERLDVVSRAYHSDNLGLFCEELAGLAGSMPACP